MGKIRAICISESKGTRKHCIKEVELIPDHGLKGDAHAGSWHRQVSLLGADQVDEFNKSGAGVEPGAFGENLLVEGIDFKRLKIGTVLKCGDVQLEITQIGKDCHTHCQIYHKMGDCIMPREGVFARVLKGGIIRIGEDLEVTDMIKTIYRAAVITMSDKGSRGEREDKSGPLIVKRLKDCGYEVIEAFILPDEIKSLEKELIRLSDQRKPDIIITTGGTGFSPRDITPEATLHISDREAPGIAEVIRSESYKITPKAMLSRGRAVIRKNTLIVNLPGSPEACMESMDAFLDVIPHGLDLLRGTTKDCASVQM